MQRKASLYCKSYGMLNFHSMWEIILSYCLLPNDTKINRFEELLRAYSKNSFFMHIKLLLAIEKQFLTLIF